ncbi:MAG TPA: aminoacyl-tRNA deacylase [Burkholderiaceae bacterium]|nr:aminoacyl-tRNA deacylase [Burkholderiaceae bacterium]
MKKTSASFPTPAVLWLQQHKITHTLLHYDYRASGGARHAAEQLQLDLHAVAKTLVMENEHGDPLVVIMHGDQEVSLKTLARQTGQKKISPCKPDTAQRHTGYLVGGTSPFATRKALPTWVQKTLLELPCIHINAGRRGLLASLAPDVLIKPLGGRPVDAAQEPR